MPKKSKLEEKLADQIEEAELPEPIREFRFHSVRRWRSDFAWPEHKLLVEAEGAVFTRGRHTQGSGFIKDIEKYNTATLMGYRVLRFARDTIYNGVAIDFIKRALEMKESERGHWCANSKDECSNGQCANSLQ